MGSPWLTPFEERFRQKINYNGLTMPRIATPCHEWTGATSGPGYGLVNRGGRMVRATHIAWELATGKPVPPGLCALHHCDNPRCVRSEHLFIGTRGDNNRDRVMKGRHVSGDFKGSNNPMARLTELDVIEMRRAYANGDNCRSIAARYGISMEHARRTIVGESWSHLTAELRR
jgi:HNH endonuclease